MKKRYKYKALTLVFINVLSCLAMFTSLTAAWFTTVRTAEATGQIFQVTDDDQIDVSFEVYDYDLDNNVGKVATNQTTKDENENNVFVSKFALPQYDSFIPERNVYNNKILRIEILSKGNVDASSKFVLNVPCSGAFLDDEEMVTKNMSNIIGFKYFFKHELPASAALDESTPSSIYDGAYRILEGINDYKSYVSVNLQDDGNGSSSLVGSKVEGNTIMFNNLDIDETAADHITVMYLEYFYQDTLVDYYFEHSHDKKATADDLESYSVSFACDIVKLQFSAGGSGS